MKTKLNGLVNQSPDASPIPIYLKNIGSPCDLTYDDYVQTEALLSLQHPLTDYHDELVFLIYHQQTELWLRLIVHEIERGVRFLNTNPADIATATDAVRRINRYFAILTNSFSVLIEGLSTEEFLNFRKAFGSASGFQSVQFRIIEILAGLERDCSQSKIKRESFSAASIGNVKVCPNNEEPQFYWERAARDKNTNQPTLTLIKFKEKYMAFLNELYSQRATLSLRFAFYRAVLNRMPEPQEAVQSLQKLFAEGTEQDLIVLAEELIKMDKAIIRWKRAHLKAAAKHLVRVPHCTVETNWRKYLAKSIHEQHYFPELRLAKQRVRADKE